MLASTLLAIPFVTVFFIEMERLSVWSGRTKAGDDYAVALPPPQPQAANRSGSRRSATVKITMAIQGSARIAGSSTIPTGAANMRRVKPLPLKLRVRCCAPTAIAPVLPSRNPVLACDDQPSLVVCSHKLCYTRVDLKLLRPAACALAQPMEKCSVHF